MFRCEGTLSKTNYFFDMKCPTKFLARASRVAATVAGVFHLASIGGTIPWCYSTSLISNASNVWTFNTVLLHSFLQQDLDCYWCQLNRSFNLRRLIKKLRFVWKYRRDSSQYWLSFWCCSVYQIQIRHRSLYRFFGS